MADEEPYLRTAASQIQQLSAISASLPLILRKTAAHASLLTQHPVQDPDADPISNTVSDRVEALQASTHELFLHINRVRMSLKAQITELEKAKVIPAKNNTTATSNATTQDGEEGKKGGEGAGLDAGITNGGMGTLDVGILNARAKARGGKDGEDEVLEMIERVVETLTERADMGSNDEGRMVVDG